MTNDHMASALLIGAGNIGALYDIDSGRDCATNPPVCPNHLSTDRLD